TQHVSPHDEVNAHFIGEVLCSNTSVQYSRHSFERPSYDIQALIGRGGFSRVVRVGHMVTRRPFAIKMMELEAPEGRERRRCCGSSLAVFRWRWSRQLAGSVSKGHFTERDATHALRMVLAGLGYLHDPGITHCDLKPENLLYYHPGPDSRLLETDFGLASCSDVRRQVRPLRTTGGTPEYMSPEILLQSGSMPFEDDNRSRLFRSIVKRKFSFNGNLIQKQDWSLGSRCKNMQLHTEKVRGAVVVIMLTKRGLCGGANQRIRSRVQLEKLSSARFIRSNLTLKATG
uniref:Si:ch211-27e6.1 n=1 Tax=Salarias fasciatus TaxID=181472 RepID=A0A672HIT7_SALFA